MKNLIQIATTLVIILSLSSSLFAGFSAERYFFIQAKVSNSNLSNENKMSAGTPIVQMAGSKDAERWRFISAGDGYYYILSKKSGLYLEVIRFSKNAEAIIIQNAVNESSAQKWKLIGAGNGYYFIQSKVSGMYLDVRRGSKADGATIWQYPLNKSDAQKWKLIDAGNVYKINQAVSASLFSNTKKRLSILHHHFNFGEDLKGEPSISITKEGSNKIIKGIFSHNQKAWDDNAYFFKITVNSSGELIEFETKTTGSTWGFAHTGSKLIGKIPLTGNEISASDNYLGLMEQKANKRGVRDWEAAADEVAVILAVAILNQHNHTLTEEMLRKAEKQQKDRQKILDRDVEIREMNAAYFASRAERARKAKEAKSLKESMEGETNRRNAALKKLDEKQRSLKESMEGETNRRNAALKKQAAKEKASKISRVRKW